MRRGYSILILFFCFFTGISCSTESTSDYTIQTSALPSESGTISPTVGNFKEGDQITFEAHPNEGWSFLRWEGATTGSENPVTIVIAEDAMLRAVFEKKQYSLGITISGEGSVTESEVSAKDYDINTTVEVEAIPEEGWSFLEWSGDLSGNENPTQILIDSPKNVVATFDLKKLPLETVVVGEGNIIKTPDKDVYNYSESVEVRAKPSEGWQFDRWESDLTGNENPITITINDSMEVRAIFKKVLFYLNITSTNGGSVEIKQLSGEEQNGLYSKGAKIELTAKPNDGHIFDEWVGDASGKQNPVQVTIQDDTYIQANFSSNCSVIRNCISTDFYASEVSGGRVRKGYISIKNILSETLSLYQINGRDEGGSLIGQEDELGIKIGPGETLGFSYSLDTEPLLNDFLEYTIEFFFTYKGESFKVVQKARESSSNSR